MSTNHSSSSPVCLVELCDSLHEVTCRVKALDRAVMPLIREVVFDETEMGFALMFQDAIDALETFEARVDAAFKGAAVRSSLNVVSAK